jgi:hypothetical protein
MHQKSPKHQQARDLVDVLVYVGRISETAHGGEYTYSAPQPSESLRHVAL